MIARLSDGCLLEVNKAFEDQIGLTAEEVIGRTGTELEIWASRASVRSCCNASRQPVFATLKCRFRAATAKPSPGLSPREPFQLDAIEAIVVVVRDITQLKETQQLLQTSEEKFAKAFHASPDGLLLSRQRDGLLIEVNEGFSRLTGYTSATSLDQSTLELGIWVDLNERKHMLELMQRDGFVRDFNLPHTP